METMETIYREYAQTVYKFLLSQCHDADLAKELTQETFYRAIRSIQRYDGSCKLSVWLCQIAKHIWYQYLRKREKQPEQIEEALVPPLPSAEEALLARQGHLELLKKIHTLPDPMREVVYLRSFGDLSFREIGAILEKTENWARVTFYRGKEKLREGEEQHEK